MAEARNRARAMRDCNDRTDWTADENELFVVEIRHVSDVWSVHHLGHAFQRAEDALLLVERQLSQFLAEAVAQELRGFGSQFTAFFGHGG